MAEASIISAGYHNIIYSKTSTPPVLHQVYLSNFNPNPSIQTMLTCVVSPCEHIFYAHFASPKMEYIRNLNTIRKLVWAAGPKIQTCQPVHAPNGYNTRSEQMLLFIRTFWLFDLFSSTDPFFFFFIEWVIVIEQRIRSYMYIVYCYFNYNHTLSKSSKIDMAKIQTLHRR